MKIHQVTDSHGTVFLVRAHTNAGAKKFVSESYAKLLHSKTATQDELVAALAVGTVIHDITPPSAHGNPESAA